MEFRPDFYEILQVDRRASQEVITAAYQILSANNSSENSENEQTMKLIQEAYEVLGDPQNRWQYDAWLSDKVPISRQSENNLAPIANRTEYKVSPGKRLSVIDAYRFGFEMVIKQPTFTLLLIILSLLTGFISVPFSYFYLQTANSILTLFPAILSIVQITILTKMILKVLDNKEIKVNNLISVRMIVNLIIYYILSAVIITLGFILIIPGIIFLLKLVPGHLLIIDEDLGPIEALKKSWNITQRFEWEIFLYGLVYLLAYVLLLLFSRSSLGSYTANIIVGLIFDSILHYSTAFFYRTLLHQTQAYEFGDFEVNAFNYKIFRLNNISLSIALVITIGLLILYVHFTNLIF